MKRKSWTETKAQEQVPKGKTIISSTSDIQQDIIESRTFVKNLLRDHYAHKKKEYEIPSSSSEDTEK